jgi:hypothetical protein
MVRGFYLEIQETGKYRPEILGFQIVNGRHNFAALRTLPLLIRVLTYST